MKKIFILSFFLSACTAQRIVTPNLLSVADKPTTASKQTLRMVTGSAYYDVVAPDNILVIKQSIYTKVGWRDALVVYYQHKIGTFWQIIEVFPQEEKYPQIQKIEQPKIDLMVVWVTLCKDLIVTRSYVQINDTWAPL